MSRNQIIAVVAVSVIAVLAGIYFAFFYNPKSNGTNGDGSTVTPTGGTVTTLPGGGSGGVITG